MQRLVTAIVLLLGIAGAFGQAMPEDMETRLATAQGSERVELLADLTERYQKIDSVKALEYGEEAVALLEKFPDEAIELKLRNDLAPATWIWGSSEKAMEHTERAIELAESTGNEYELTEALNSLGYLHIRKGDGESSRKILERSMALAEKLNHKPQIALSLRHLGYTSYMIADFEDAINYYNRSLRIMEEINDPSGISDNLNAIGSVFRALGDYSKALQYKYKSLQLREKTENKRVIGNSINSIGTVNRNLTKYDEALKYHHQALAIFEEIDYKLGKSNALNGLGVVYRRLKEYDKSVTNYLEALRLRMELGNKRRIANTLSNFGNTYSDMREYDKALSLFLQALRIRESTGNKQGIAETKYNAGRTFRRMGNTDEAINYLNQSLEMAQSIGYKDGISDSYRGLSRVYESTGDFEEAFINYKKHKGVENELIGFKTHQEVAKFQIRLEFLDKEQQIELLKRDSQIQQAKLEKNEFQRNALIQIQQAKLEKNEFQRNALIGGAALLLLLVLVILNSYYFKWRSETRYRLRTKELEVIDRVVKAINKEETLEDLLQAVLKHGRTLFPQAHRAAFWLQGDAPDDLRLVASDGFDDPELLARTPLSQSKIGNDLQDAEVLEDGIFLIRNKETISPLGGLPISRLMVAIALEDRVEGWMVFDQPEETEAFLPAEMDKLIRFREHAVSAIIKARVLEMTKRARSEAEKANELKTQLMSIVCHDLRSPLGAVIGLAEEIQDELHDPSSEAARMAGLISNSGNQIMDLAQNLLDFSALELEKMELDVETVDVAELATMVAEEFYTEVERKNQRLVLSMADEGQCAIKADENRLRRVVENLLSNAIKYSPPDSTINLKVEKRDKVRIEVRDEGPGFTEDDKTRLFGEFQRLSAQPTGGETSIGLGLSIVKRFVELHNGRVWLENGIDGKGSTFIVELPA